ncbi:RE1, partial [Symbiodinium sp. CCMP2456]
MTSSGDQAGGLTKGRDGIPSWDGTTSSFQSYVEAAELYEQGTPYHKRYLCGPKLQAELTGTARRHVVGQRPDWLSHEQGVHTLLQHLRKCLGKPQLPELTELLAQYFKGSRRYHGEGMGSYISRKCELYIRAQQAMSRVQPHHDTAAQTRWASRGNYGYSDYGGTYSRRSSLDSHVSDGDTEADTVDTQAAAPTATPAATGANAGHDEDHAWNPNGGDWARSQWGWQGWDWNTSWAEYPYGAWTWPRTTRDERTTLPELVPEFVQAWFLLQDAGLEQSEKNLVLTAIKGEMDLQKMAQELRTQFPEPELKRRDSHRRQHHGLMGMPTEEDDGGDDEGEAGHDLAFEAEEELTDEGYALWSSATEEAEQAFAALQGARRTLKEARERQKQVRLNRRYFRGPGGGKGGSSGPRDDSKISCFNCGQMGHRTANCPKKKGPGAPPENMAPFVCYAGYQEDNPEQQALAVNAPTTQEAILQGKCVVDSGATKSLGSVKALEQVMNRAAGVVNHIDLQDRPVFGFGNSSEDACISTVHLNVSAGGKPGTLKVHALDTGEGPILFSIDALRSLGAIVDYSADLMVLRNLDKHQLIRLERSSAGHQLFPLTEDFFEHAEPAIMEELRLALAQLGEQPPSSWTKVELRLRLEQVTGEDMSQKIKKKPIDRSPYEIMVAQLNASSKNKRTLINFCERDLMMHNLDRWSIPRIQHEAMKKIYNQTAAHPSDLVGFGAHAALTYRQIQHEQEGYCLWLKKEAKKGPDECDARLIRLANWLEMEGDIEMKASESKINVLKLAAAKKASKPEAASSSENTEVLLRNMYETIEGLKEEIASLKGEPQRKAAASRETHTETKSPDMKPTTPSSGKKGLVRGNRPVMMEIACQPSSLLAAKIQELAQDEHAAVRCSKWNACDLETNDGVPSPKDAEWDYEQASLVKGNGAHAGMFTCPKDPEVADNVVCEVRMMRQNNHGYLILGMYAYGNHYGVTNHTRQLPWTTKYLLQYLQYQAKVGTWNRVIGYLREGWAQYFGMPRALRVDPAGCFRGEAMVEFCDRNSIYLDIIPADGHWQVGVCEQAVQGVKSVMHKLAADDEEASVETLLAQAVHVFNARDHVRGFSPVQHVFGRSPDITGRLVATPHQVPDELVVESACEDFERSARLRAEAEKAHAQWHTEQRISRALNSRTKPVYDYRPGDLIYFWRSQESGQGRKKPGTKHGRYLGPARVLATETRKESDGTLRPGSAVWCVRGRSLIKCCPEQLRHASEREELLEGLSREHGQEETPWTFTKVAEEIGGNQYEDVSMEKPSDEEWSRAQDVTREAPPTRYRFRGKRAVPEPSEEMDPAPEEEHSPSQSSQPARRRDRFQAHSAAYNAKGETWTQKVPESAWSAQVVDYWTANDAAVEVSLELPDTAKAWSKATQNFQGYFIGALKRRAVEVSEKRLSPQELAQFKEAKAIEVKNFIAAEAFQALPPHLRPHHSQAIGMRWLLTWKPREDGSKKAKARAVLLGYQDVAYEHRATTSPVMTRQSRQMLLQAAANHHWTVHKGDVSGAFLQGRPYPDDLYCIPCDEICQAMNLPAGTVTKLKRACYGLVDAPLEWYKTVHEFFMSLGVLGAISWHAQQVAPQYSAEVSLLLSEVNKGTVDTVIRTNQLLANAKAQKGHCLRIHRFPADQQLGLFAWVDAGSQNRPDGGSTQGIVIGLAPVSLLQGDVCPISLMAWHSNRIERTCRSPGAAETQAAVSGEDLLYYARYEWSEIMFGVADAKAPDAAVTKVTGAVISDSRNVFDKLQTEVLSIKGAERKADIELLSIKEAQQRTKVLVRWVHSEAQLANSLTKCGGSKEIELFYKMNSSWRIVEDEQMRSARKRK